MTGSIVLLQLAADSLRLGAPDNAQEFLKNALRLERNMKRRSRILTALRHIKKVVN